METIKKIIYFLALGALFASGGWTIFKTGALNAILAGYSDVANVIGVGPTNLIISVCSLFIVSALIGIFKD